MSIILEQDIDLHSSNTINNIDGYRSLDIDNSIELSMFLVIDELLKQNKLNPLYKKILKKQRKSIFNSERIPKIGILEYLHRLNKYCEIERSTLICTLIYLDRIIKNFIIITEYDIHRLLLMSLITSIKYNEDVIYDNMDFSKIAGISLKEFNKIETEFLLILNFKLYIKEIEFQQYKKYLDNYCYKKKC
jgi:hypothetical protein